MDAVIEDEPAIGRLERRWTETDLAGVPPGAIAGLEQQLVITPVAEVWREGDPHVGAATQLGRTVDHGPSPIESAREERGVLVLGRHDRPESADAPEVGGHRE